jgi:hypothetical protein
MAMTNRPPGKSRVMAALRVLEAEQAKKARREKKGDVLFVDEMVPTQPAKRKTAKKGAKRK